MAEKKEKELHLIETELKQKQSFLNLQTNEEEDVVVVTKKYSVPTGMATEVAIKEAENLVKPASKRLAALLKFAESESYQESKAAALAKGEYLTPQVKSKIVGIMQTLDAFAEVGARDCFARWFAGYKEKKPSAMKLLERARATEEFSDL